MRNYTVRKKKNTKKRKLFNKKTKYNLRKSIKNRKYIGGTLSKKNIINLAFKSLNVFDKLLDKKNPKEPTLFLDIRFIILNKYLDDNCRKSKIIANARERKQKDKCSHIQNKKNYIKILQNKKMKSIRREIKRIAIFNMKHIPHFHRKKLKSNTNPIISIKFLSACF